MSEGIYIRSCESVRMTRALGPGAYAGCVVVVVIIALHSVINVLHSVIIALRSVIIVLMQCKYIIIVLIVSSVLGM